MIQHLSISSYNSFISCGEAWRRRYLEDERLPPGIAARIGTGVHHAAETNYSQKIESGVDMPLSDIQDAAATAYDAAVSDGVHFAPEDEGSKDKIISTCKDTAVTLAGLYAEQLAPTIQPKFVERKIMLELPSVELPIMAIIDLYTQDNSLRDLKTASKSWTQDKADLSPQITLYREAIRHNTGSYPTSMGFDVLVSLKTPKLQRIETTRQEHDIHLLALKMQTMLNAVKAGVFLPAESGSWMCSPKWCGYYHTCKYVSPYVKNVKASNQICEFSL